MKTSLLTSAVAILIFTGCANSDKLEQQVSTLSNKVDKLTIEVSKLKEKQDSNERQLNEFKKAHKQTMEKLDNVTASFKK